MTSFSQLGQRIFFVVTFITKSFKRPIQGGAGLLNNLTTIKLTTTREFKIPTTIHQPTTEDLRNSKIYISSGS